MGGLSNVHMPSSARDAVVAINIPPQRSAAMGRNDADLFMFSGLLICRLCESIVWQLFVLLQTRWPA
jgi:hypothetical protein